MNPIPEPQMKKKALILLLASTFLLLGIFLMEWFRSRSKPLSQSEAIARIDEMMESPVEFYGKVLDQGDKPVVGVVIRCSWPFMTSMDGLQVKSGGPDGRFEVKGRKAMEMIFSVIPPDGYRKTETSSQRFQFADESESFNQIYKQKGKSIQAKHQPDPANPVVFKIKKIGAADVLYKANQGADILPRDGSPRYYSVSAPSGKGVAQPSAHSIEVRLFSSKEPDDNSIVPASWSMRIGVPGGGVQLLDAKKNPLTSTYDELYAPEGGYHDELAFEFPDTMPEWRPQFEKEFLFRFSDNTYGHATISGDWKRVRIESLYNPSGSRNLLFDESKSVDLRNKN